MQCALELVNLYSILSQLDFWMVKGVLTQRWYTAVRALTVENGPLDQFKEGLKMLQDKLTNGGQLTQVGKEPV